MTAVLTLVEPKNITHLVPENFPNRTVLSKRYGMTKRSLGLWHNFLNIEGPAPDGYFTLEEVILLDEFWLAQKVLRVSQSKFKTAVLLTPDGSFEKLVAKYTSLPLIDYLKTSTQYRDHPVVRDTIARLEAESQKQTA